MKEKFSYILSNSYSDFDRLVNTLGCVEEVERVFNIEFAAGIEYEGDNKKIIFASDYLFKDKEDEYLEKYDGLVEPLYFRDKTTHKLYDLNLSGCRLDITYDDQARYSGDEDFCNPKIITKGYNYPQSKTKKKM